ncbi:MAG: hypothetical protein PHU25_21540 [Deltaproteobacteria bacterium]|nr:hypothetical protein [Deltaproteobacteria bacterium]
MGKKIRVNGWPPSRIEEMNRVARIAFNDQREVDGQLNKDVPRRVGFLYISRIIVFLRNNSLTSSPSQNTIRVTRHLIDRGDRPRKKGEKHE